MISKTIKSTKLTDTLTMSECKDGYWLFDYTRGMNLSMSAKTEQIAYVDALSYYQKRCEKVEWEKEKLYNSVSNFINSIADNDEIHIPCDCDDL